MDVKGKRILVVGAGKSGRAAAGFLATKGAQSVLTDIKPAGEFGDSVHNLRRLGVELVLGAYPPVERGKFDLVVVSPGVPLTAQPLVQARKAGVTVMGELELAWQFTSSPVVAITGTNGKTTTTALLGEIFKNAGYRTLVAGNIGTPLVDLVEGYGPGDIIVAEVSSFQLETTLSFRPRAAAILNLTPDHLDRHKNMENYVLAKAKILTNQKWQDKAVLNYDDTLVKGLAECAPGQVIFFSRRHNLEKGVFVQNGKIVFQPPGGRMVEVMPASEVALPGAHNLENSLAAAACALVMGVMPEKVAGTLRSFPGVPHRLEFVAEINGVRYINDSKGTNPEASIKALDAFNNPIVLIAGGRNKGSSFHSLARKMKEKARVVIVLGECAEELAFAAREAGCQRVLKVQDFHHAVLLAREEAQPGEIVLLSPACASWDMFKSYEERGDYFKEIVHELRG